MIYVQIFLAFFIPGIIAYGGGPASIPLMEYEVVQRYGWLSAEEFGEVLAFSNILPGPIATKMACYIGYEVGGIGGGVVALIATVGPSTVLMIVLIGLLYRYKNSPRVQRLTMLVKPAIAVMLMVMTYNFFKDSFYHIGLPQTFLIGSFSLLLLSKTKIHPGVVLLAALIYGGFMFGLA